MLTVDAAVWSPADPWPDFCRRGPGPVADALGAAIAAQIDRATEGMDPASIGATFVVSTMLDMPVTAGWLRWPDVAAAARRARAAPETFLNAYECASWGFALRYAMRLLPPGARVVVAIVDVNVLDLEYWKANPNWGTSGFGIGAVVFRLSGEDALHCAFARTASGYGEFCLDLRRAMAESAGTVALAPWFPAPIAAMYDRLVDRARLLPNRNDVWGHSFGCDPWIGLIEHVTGAYPDAPPAPDARYLATSIALSGYWAFAEVAANPAGRFEIAPRILQPMERAA